MRNASLDKTLQFCDQSSLLYICESESPTPVYTMYTRVFMFLDIHASKVENNMNENDLVVRFVFDCGLYESKISCS